MKKLLSEFRMFLAEWILGKIIWLCPNNDDGIILIKAIGEYFQNRADKYKKITKENIKMAGDLLRNNETPPRQLSLYITPSQLQKMIDEGEKVDLSSQTVNGIKYFLVL